MPRPAPTTPPGVVVHGIARRKDLGNVRRWLEASNKDLGTIAAIRWLLRKSILVKEGKKTSSAVVYLETQTEVGKVARRKVVADERVRAGQRKEVGRSQFIPPALLMSAAGITSLRAACEY
ncbi:hypothetical protein BDZ91DRAFT_797830 [Kalaharituber pfeilii]|nr:hypothetical protein BDZ91DRAFT_797830 [Kalaharituber pfeilii]